MDKHMDLDKAVQSYRDGDYETAVPLLKQYAEERIPEGCTLLGHCYFNGLGVIEDKTKAIGYYLTAAKQNDPEALVSLGNIYIDCDLDQEALYSFKKAAEIGSADAVFNLALIYYQGLKTVPHDYAKAAFYLQFLTDHGIEDDEVYALLGRCYVFMENKDLDKAFAVFKKAASMGNKQAQKDMNTLLTGGRIIEESY